MKNMNIKKNISVIGALLVSLFIFTGFFALNVTVANADCVLTRGQFGEAKENGLITGSVSSNGQAVVHNGTSCSFPVTLTAYKMYDRTLTNQVNFSNETKTAIPNSNTTLNVTLPPCMAQIDLYYGSVFNSAAVLDDNADQLISWAYYQNDSSGGYGSASGNFCSNTPPTPTLTASCSVTPSSVNTGSNVVWGIVASGGTGSYSYSWTGTDGLSGNTNYLSKTYSSAGTKTGTVTVTSGTQTVVRSCSMTVNQVIIPDPVLSGSCSANPTSVTVGNSIAWTATASGGTGSYTYSWTGTDSLYGNADYVSKVYTTAGSKTGIVTITSGTQSITRNCSAVVNAAPIINDLAVSCYANPSVIDTFEDVTFRATASGGNGSYTYSWTGSSGFGNDNTQNVTRSYGTSGTKQANVTVFSDGQTASASCTVRVDAEEEEEEEDDDLEVSCYANPSTIQAGNQVRWTVSVSGGDGDYDYDWSGTDGLNSSSRSPSISYDTPGSKRATVLVEDGDGQSDSATCYANVNSVLAYSQSYQTPLASAVYLSQVPYTGPADNAKSITFITILGLLSAWVVYIVVSYKKERGEWE
jgi:hypothetical protein